MRILYTKSSRERLPRFQIETSIFEHNGIKGVRKKPLSEEAKMHICSIYEHSVNLSNVYKNVDVLMPKLVENNLHFPYIKGDTWDQIVVRRLLDRDKEGFIKLLHEFYNLLLNLQNNKAENFKSSPAFQEIFGVNLEMESVVCLDPANVDIIFDNMLVNEDGRTIMFDCEWVFPFKIPILFVMWRSLYALWIKHQFEIRILFEFDEICSWFGITHEWQTVFEVMEENYFQVYVHGTSSANYLSNYLKPNYSVEMLTNLVNREQFELKVFLPVNKVYTYIQTCSAIFGDEYQEFVFCFSETFEDHLRIDPIDVAGLVEIQSIKVYQIEDGELRELIAESSAQNGFNNLTYSEEIIPTDHPDIFTFLTLNGHSHLFLKINDPVVVGDFQVRITMRATSKTTETHTNQLVTFRNRLTEQEKVISDQLVELHQLENIIADKESVISSNNIRMQSLKIEIGEQTSTNHQLQIQMEKQISANNDLQIKIEEQTERIRGIEELINNIYKSNSWRITAPFRFLARSFKGK
jgi:hypothetical protein